MAISVQCSQCGFSRTVPDEFAGKQGKCPQCGTAVRVPQATSPQSPSPGGGQPAVRPTAAVKPAQPCSAPVARRLPPAPPKSPPAPAPVEELETGYVVEPLAPEPLAPEPIAEMPDPQSPVADEENPWADLADSVSVSRTPSRPGRGSDKRASARKRIKIEPKESDADSRSGSSRRKKQPQGLPVPAWVVAAVVGGVLLVGGGVGYLMMGSAEPVKVSKKKSTKSKKGDPKAAFDLTSAGKMKSPEEALGLKTKSPIDDPRPPLNAPLEDMFAWVKPGIVVIEVFSGGQQIGMGSGFVVDPSGIIVTNYHVSSPGDAAYVKFTDDSRYEVAGYLAVKPEWDLAVLQLKGKPEHLRVLGLVHDSKPREASEVIAVGSPLGHTFVPTKGIVGKVVQAADLPPSARQFVLEATGHDEQFWIEHDAQIAPGNSGGPLFNRAGDVVGVNSWVDGSVRFGYAIWSWYVYDLLSDKLPSPEPLVKYKKSDVSPGERLVADLTVEGLQKAFDDADALKWSPKTAADYLRFQELGKMLAVGRHADKLGLSKEIAAKSVELSGKLAAKTWTTDENITSINRLAAAELNKPGNGTLLFGKIKSKQSVQRITIIMVALEGSGEIVALPVAGVEAALKEGTHCLVMGIISTGTIPFATPEEGRQEARILEPTASVVPVAAPAAAPAG